MNSKEGSPVDVADFISHVEEYSRNGNELFGKEFDHLKMECPHPSTAEALLPINVKKVRYIKLPPVDRTRVQLQYTGQEGSEFINANYMPGNFFANEYIATQGPMGSTRNDFWRMVWEQGITAIVMLTKCYDKDVEKCNHYWPENVQEPWKYGEILVDITKQTIEKEWTVTEMDVTRGEETRNITHFHFTAWPDFGVPKRPKSLIDFLKLVNKNMRRGGAPLLAHCSAGIGRTGTFLTLDITSQQIENNNGIDVFGTIRRLRNCRIEMVETLDQYIFIHKCLEELIKEQQQNVYSIYLANK